MTTREQEQLDLLAQTVNWIEREIGRLEGLDESQRKARQHELSARLAQVKREVLRFHGLE